MSQAGKRLYFDYNATAPLIEAARQAIIDSLDAAGNPSSVHSEGRKARAMIESARRKIAALTNARPDHVFFTSGATEAATTLLSPLYKMGKAPVRFSKLYVAATEHPCMRSGGRFDDSNIVILPVHKTGLLDMDALLGALQGHDKSEGLPLVCVQMANNETGVIQPTQEIAAIVRNCGGVLVTDAVQAAGRMPIDMTQNIGDFLIISSHKIGGPKGVGAIVALSDLMMPVPLIRGGGQEKGHRGGTEALQLIAGFGAAAEYAHDLVQADGWPVDLREYLETEIFNYAPNAIIHGSKAPRLINTCFFSLAEQKAETLQIAFDLAGIAVSAGSACSSGKVGASEVLTAMGVENNLGAIRVSFAPDNTRTDIGRFIAVLDDIILRHNKAKSFADRAAS